MVAGERRLRGAGLGYRASNAVPHEALPPLGGPAEPRGSATPPATTAPARRGRDRGRRRLHGGREMDAQLPTLLPPSPLAPVTAARG